MDELNKSNLEDEPRPEVDKVESSEGTDRTGGGEAEKDFWRVATSLERWERVQSNVISLMHAPLIAVAACTASSRETKKRNPQPD